jgi:hypothetical protein
LKHILAESHREAVALKGAMFATVGLRDQEADRIGAHVYDADANVFDHVVGKLGRGWVRGQRIVVAHLVCRIRGRVGVWRASMWCANCYSSRHDFDTARRQVCEG